MTAARPAGSGAVSRTLAGARLSSLVLGASLLAAACHDAGRRPAQGEPTRPGSASSAASLGLPWTVQDLPLPGASAPASLDYLAYEPRGPASAGGRVWVPVGVTGSVDVLETAGGGWTRVDGFKTAVRERRDGHGLGTRTVGPSAVAIGDGFAYVGNRATNEICPVSLVTLSVGPCVAVGRSTDGVAYVARTKEVWVTTPDEETLTVLDAAAPPALGMKASIKVGGAPEGYAVDETRGLFFTNLEDKDRTVVVDIDRRTVLATWDPGCGPGGPRGVAVDSAARWVFVACTDHVQVLDAARAGARLGRVDAGGGIDNLDYQPRTHRLFIAAGKAARLTVVEATGQGELRVVAEVGTHDGARNAVVDARGAAYIADSAGARLVVASPPAAGN